MQPQRWHNARPAAFSALAALIVYAITLGGTFIYDDFALFQTDERLNHVARWKEFWTDSYNGGIDNLYRPLVSMTYAVQWKMHGDRVEWPYHAVNWLLHAAVCAVLAEFVRRLSPSPWQGEGWGEGRSAVNDKKRAYAPTPHPASPPRTGERSAAIALTVGLLFAVHPLHVEAVANIVGRAELMCALGFIGAMMLFLHRPLTTNRALAIFVCFIFALLSKEQGMLLPLMLLMLGLTIRFRPVDRRERNALMTLAILLCFSLAGYIVFRESILKFWWDRAFLDWTINPLKLSTGADRYLVPVAILGRYTALLVLPLHLSADYGANVIGWTARWNEPYLYIGFAAIIGWLIACVFAFLKRNTLSIVALIGLAITYGVISNFTSLIGTNFGERLMYLPSAFFLIWIGTLLIKLPRKTLIACTTVLVLAASIQTFTYAQRWNDRLGFYRWSVEHQPAAIRLRMLLMSELKAQGNLEEAAAEGERARALLPNYDEIWLHSADIEIERGNYDEAMHLAQHAMDLNPSAKADSWMRKIERERAKAATRPSTTQIAR